MLTLLDLPRELLARILCTLPCDEHARCVVLNRRFASLIGSGATWTRVAFACNRTVDVATRRTLLQRAGGALREVDVSEAHAADVGVLSATLALLTEAQRGALTALRCTQRRGDAHSATLLPDVEAALARCPSLQSLDVDVYCDTVAPLAALMRERPQLHVHRAHFGDFVQGETLTATHPDFQTVLRGCDDVRCDGMLEPLALSALEAALEAERGGGGPCARVFLRQRAADALRLARQPCVTGIQLVGGWSDAELDELCTALETPDCSVRALSLSGNDSSNEDLSRLAEALERGVRLEELDLRFDFDEFEEHVGYEEVLERGLNFPLFCTKLATSQLHTLRLRGLGSMNFSALLLLVRASRALRHLSLSNCNVGTRRLEELAKVLASPRSRLVTLHISYEGLGPGGATALAEMLRHNTSLRELHAGGLDIIGGHRSFIWSDSDVETVLEALRENTTLRQLTLPKLDADGELPHAWSVRELRVAALCTECPRAADVRISEWSD